MHAVYYISAAVAFCLLLSSTAVTAHPGEVEPVLTARQLERRQAALNARHNKARNCDSAIIQYEAKRRARRSGISKRAHKPKKGLPKKGNHFLANVTSGSLSASTSAPASASASASATSSANDPTFTALQNVSSTCSFKRPFSLIVPLSPTDYLRAYPRV